MQASAVPDFETKLSESYKAIPDGDCRLAGVCGLSRLATCFTTWNILNYIVQLFVSLAQFFLSFMSRTGAVLHGFIRWVSTTVHWGSKLLSSLNTLR